MNDFNDAKALLKIWQRRDLTFTELVHRSQRLNHKRLAGKYFWFEHEKEG